MSVGLCLANGQFNSHALDNLLVKVVLRIAINEPLFGILVSVEINHLIGKEEFSFLEL
jgi:hypothetical protein